jgi:hypothetical protein
MSSEDIEGLEETEEDGYDDDDFDGGGLRLVMSDTELVDPVAAVRWCISDKTRNRIKDSDEIMDPYILISVVHITGSGVMCEESRHICKLASLMCHLTFKRPGQYVLFAAIVWRDYDDEDIIAYYLRKHSASEYRCSVIQSNYAKYGVSPDGECFELNANYCMCRTKLEINVDKSLFAPPPNRFEKWWVELMYESPSRDQCQFRRRRIYAYSLKPFVFCAYASFQFVVGLITYLFWLSMGMRDLKFSPVIHPFSERLDSIKRNCSSSVFFSDKNGQPRGPQYLFLMPTIFIPIVLVTALMLRDYGIMIGIAMGLFMVLNAFLTTSLFYWLVSRYMDNTSEDREARELVKQRERQERELELVRCDLMPLEARIEALPPEVVTLRLRWTELKKKVCRPFAG